MINICHLAYYSSGHEATVKQLLSFGASTNIADSDGDYAIHFATQNNRPKCVKTLLDAGKVYDLKGLH